MKKQREKNENRRNKTQTINRHRKNGEFLINLFIKIGKDFVFLEVARKRYRQRLLMIINHPITILANIQINLYNQLLSKTLTLLVSLCNIHLSQQTMFWRKIHHNIFPIIQRIIQIRMLLIMHIRVSITCTILKRYQ